MIKCDVIQDLIPLYYDEVASKGSRALVDEHIKECAVCAELLAKYNDNSETEVFNVDNNEIDALKKIKRRIKRKTVLITLSAIMCTVILIWAVFTWQKPTPYNADNIAVHPVNSLQLPFHLSQLPNEGEVMNSFPILDVHNNYYAVTIMQIGDELFLSSSNTFYTRFIRQSGSGRWFAVGQGYTTMTGITILHMPSDYNMWFEIGDEINRVYFMNANYNRLFRLASDDNANEEAAVALERAKRNAVLVWQR